LEINPLVVGPLATNCFVVAAVGGGEKTHYPFY
jgi:hypothetical protein